ncbi:hypothetical protein HDV05_001907 [Chytridiales sp. JEL 0842]|nr:hypothetical protein HDV05_001907 [Chytridiales sp. JEL 0842]
MGHRPYTLSRIFKALLTSCAVLIFLFAQSSDAFLENCRTASTYTCTPSDSNFMVPSGPPFIVSNCVLIACPSVMLADNTALVLNNVTFSNSYDRNGAIKTWGVNVRINMTSVRFVNCKHDDPLSSGVITSSASGSVYIFRDVQFLNNIAKAATIFIDGSGGNVFDFDGLLIDGTRTNNAWIGHGIVSHRANISIKNSIMRNMVSAFYCSSQSNCVVQNSSFYDLEGSFGGLGLWVDSRSTALIQDSRFYNIKSRNGGNGGVALRSYNGVTLRVERSIFRNLTSTSEGGGFIVQLESTFTFVDCLIEEVHNGMNNGGVFMIYDRGNVNLINTIIQNTSGSTNFHFELYGLLQATNVTMRNFTGGYAGIHAGYATSTVLTDTIIESHSSSGITMASDSRVETLGNTIFRNNKGQAIDIDGKATLRLGGNTLITNNTGYAAGGISTTAKSQPSIIFDSTDIAIYGNKASQSVSNGFNFGHSNLGGISIAVRGGGLGVTKLPGITDNLYVSDPNVADDFIKSNLMGSFVKATTYGRACRIVRNTTVSSYSLLLSQGIPSFELTTLDYFNNSASVNLNSIVIVRVKEVKQNASLIGESIKSIVNEETRSVIFSGLTLANVQPGNYSLRIDTVGTALSPLPNQTSALSIDLSYQTCHPTEERLILEKSICAPVVRMAQTTRLSFSIINLIMAFLSLISTALLLFYQNVRIIRASSPKFLMIIGVGCALYSLSIGIQVVGISEGCMVAMWLNNLGFTMIFMSVILKTYRIQVIFNSKVRNKNKISLLKDTTMFIVLGSVLVIVIGALLAWTFVNPSKFVESFDQNVVVLDRCDKSAFSVIMIVIHLFVQLTGAYTAFMIRQIPSDYNESKQIGFTTYNWIIFGAIMIAIEQYLITDHNAAFYIKGASVALTTGITLYFLIVHKLLVCVLDPEKADAELSTGSEVVTANSRRASKASGRKKSLGHVLSQEQPRVHLSSTTSKTESV